MSRNIEIKARIASIDALLPQLAAFADSGPHSISQDDTFFRCNEGRLKLRAFADDDGQLIWYQRADSAGPKESFYLISPTASPGTLRDALTRAHGQIGRVRKQRILFMIGRTRVHLDRVEDLGEFLELEVVLAEGEDPQAGVDEAQRLMARLGIAPESLVEGAYLDLLAARAEHGRIAHPPKR